MHLKQKKKLIFFMSKKTKIVAIQGDKLKTINKDTDTSLFQHQRHKEEVIKSIIMKLKT